MKMKKIAFYQPHLDIQGTGVSCFEYAYYNQTLLGNKSFMIYDKDDHRSHPLAIKKFEDSPIETIAIEGSERMDLLEKTLERLNVDAVYIQKCGKRNDGRFVNNKPMLIHVVGLENDPHGLVYAYVSEWSAQHCSDGWNTDVTSQVKRLMNDKTSSSLHIKADNQTFGDTARNIPKELYVEYLVDDEKVKLTASEGAALEIVVPASKRFAIIKAYYGPPARFIQHPVVPYVISLPDHNQNFRDRLNIPNRATVFGRIGGFYSWDIPFAAHAVVEAVNSREDIYFVFVQTHKFIDHPRVLHIDPFADLNVKRQFINTCDAFLHARRVGESFGMAVAEFSICNKPVITYSGSPERNHIYQLKDKGVYYTDYSSLLNILTTFKYDPNTDWNAYREFTPQNVMKKFNEVFLEKL